MRRFKYPALLLAFLLALSACGGQQTPRGEKSSLQDSEDQSPNAEAGSEEDVTVYDCGGLQIALPTRYIGQLLIKTEFPDAETGWTPLLEVCEKASYEAAMAVYGSGGGFLFGFAAFDQAAFEQMISADGSGVDIFATDGERYFAYTYPTDVQFFRPGGEFDTESEDWKTWEELNEIGPVVREDFLTRNGLQSFTVRDYTDQQAELDHVCIRYYPYFLKDRDTRIYYQLLLRQPARQGEGGVWAVDQWLDVFGSQSLYFPDSGMPSAEYYARLQEECDAGQHPEYLTPAGAAAVFVRDLFGHETGEGSFEEVPAVDHGYIERNQALQQMVLNVMFDRVEDDMELLECVGGATADNWGVLGRYQYGSNWFQPLMDAVSSAAVDEDQQARDKAVMSFYLATQDTQTDFHTPLSGLLQVQRRADPEAFQAALSEFSQEDQELLEGATIAVWSSPCSSDIPELVEAAGN